MYEILKLKLFIGLQKLPNWESLLMVTGMSVLFWRWGPVLAEHAMSDQKVIGTITHSIELAGPVAISVFMLMTGLKFLFTKYGDPKLLCET